MNKIITMLSIFLMAAGVFAADKVDYEVKKITVDVPVRFNVSYNGKQKSLFKNGLPLGIGSGMFYAGKDSKGNMTFIAITDRGPNADSPKVEPAPGSSYASKLFPAPGFCPQFGLFELNGETATLKSVTTLKVNKKNISGLPLPMDLVGSTKEIAIGEDLKDIGTDKNGLDTEGISIDRKDGNYWICDEYGPFIAKINSKTGEVIKKYTPGTELPEIIKLRQPNRGFEGVTVAPDNKVYAIVQSILDIDGKVKESKSTFVRLVELDAATGKTKMFAYPHDVSEYGKSADAKIGDIVSVGNGEFLVIEQGEDKNGNMRNLIYKINILNATDLSGVKTADGKELELEADRSKVEALGVKYAQKTLVADLRAGGWNVEKAEGIAVVDNKTICVTSDNDFGIKVNVVNPALDKEGKPVKKESKYVINKNGEVLYDGAVSGAGIEIKVNDEVQNFWMINFKSPIF